MTTKSNFSTYCCRGGINLTFTGMNFDVVVEPVFVYTDARLSRSVGVSQYIHISELLCGISCTLYRLDGVMEHRVT